MRRKKWLSLEVYLVIVCLCCTGLIQLTMATDQEKNEQSMLGSGMYQLLIIAPNTFIDELQPLVCHKKHMGISTRLVSLAEVYHQMYWEGRDEAEKIKFFIKNAIEYWEIKYVLLVGGKVGQSNTWYMPVRYVHMQNDWESEILCDLYFADIYDCSGHFSSWDSDNDGVFGEWYIGESAQDVDIDLHPDVALGRLPCRNEREVNIMVDKIIDYETKTFGDAWFTNIAVIAGDTYPETNNPNWTGYEGEYYGDLAIENMTGFTPIRCYTSDATFTGFNDVRRVLRQGCGFLYFVGHGSPKTWGNNKPNGTGLVRGLTTHNVHRLRNNLKYPVCVLSGCHNLQFDVSFYRLFNATTRYRQEGVLESLGWRLTRKIHGGSIATIGCTALGFTKEDKDSFTGGINEIEVAFFNAYGQQDKHILGDAWASAISWYVNTYPVNWTSFKPGGLPDSWIDAQVPETWILFGDPSLMIGGYPL